VSRLPRLDATARRVVVSVHDVCPLHLAEVRWLLERLDGLGVRPRVLKVIPNEGGAAPIDRDPGLVALIREEVARGSEIVLHGHTHRTEGPIHGTPLDRIRARLFAADSAEFLSLPRRDAVTRIEAGMAICEGIGIRPTGFCPPAWLADRGLASVLRSAGLRYFVTFLWLHDLQRRLRRAVPAVGYMGAGPSQERLVAIERLLVTAAASRLPAVRVFLHPHGASRSRACSAVLGSLERLMSERTPVTYAALLDA